MRARVRACVSVCLLHVVANTDGVVRPLLRAMPALEVFCAIDSCLGHRETFEQCVPLSTVAPPASHSRRIAAPSHISPNPVFRRAGNCQLRVCRSIRCCYRLPSTLRVCRVVAEEPGTAPRHGLVAASIVHALCSMRMLRELQLFHVTLCADSLLALLCNCTSLLSAMLEGGFDRGAAIKPRSASKSTLRHLVVKRPTMPYLELVLDVAPELSRITIIDDSQHIVRTLERLISERGRAITLRSHESLDMCDLRAILQ